MNKKEALEILRTATGLLTLNRADHLKIIEALSTIEKALSDKD